jgi:hypothetical protein
MSDGVAVLCGIVLAFTALGLLLEWIAANIVIVVVLVAVAVCGYYTCIGIQELYRDWESKQRLDLEQAERISFERFLYEHKRQQLHKLYEEVKRDIARIMKG